MNINEANILHGTIDIANQMFTIAEELKKWTNLTSTLNYYPNYLEYKKADYVLDINKFSTLEEANCFYKHFMNRFINLYDIFHFHFGTSITLDGSDLPILKGLGKKVFMHHWGSDVRQLSIANKYNKYAVVKNRNELEIKKRLEYFGKYIKTCFVADYELYLYVKDFYEQVIYIPQIINLDNYPVSYNNIKSDEFIIVHAPTNKEIKGTKYIISAVEKLSKIYNIKFILIENISHKQALEIYKEADLIIDQLCIGTYGLLAIEAMALGKPVISYINEVYAAYYPNDLPIISANPDNIDKVLTDVLGDKFMLRKIGINSRQFVEKYHDSKKVIDKIIKHYQFE